MQVNGLEIFEDEDLLVIHMEGSHFLWKMVRRIVGVLVEVGRGAMPRADAERLLREPSPLVARLTAPASGLFLERVFYPDDPRDTPWCRVAPRLSGLRFCVAAAYDQGPAMRANRFEKRLDHPLRRYGATRPSRVGMKI